MLGKALVASAFHVEVILPLCGDTGAQAVRGFRLAGAGDIVQLAFNSEQGHRGDVLRTHQVAAHFPGTLGQLVLLELR